jgi:hypothetical protein
MTAMETACGHAEKGAETAESALAGDEGGMLQSGSVAGQARTYADAVASVAGQAEEAQGQPCEGQANEAATLGGLGGWLATRDPPRTRPCLSALAAALPPASWHPLESELLTRARIFMQPFLASPSLILLLIAMHDLALWQAEPVSQPPLRGPLTDVTNDGGDGIWLLLQDVVSSALFDGSVCPAEPRVMQPCGKAGARNSLDLLLYHSP